MIKEMTWFGKGNALVQCMFNSLLGHGLFVLVHLNIINIINFRII